MVASSSLARLKMAHRWVVGAAFIAVLGVGLVFCGLLEQGREADARTLALETSVHMSRQIDQHLAQNLSATYALAALIRQGRGRVESFDAIASEFLSLHPGVSALQLAPDGVIRQSVPLVGNEKAIGHNLLTDERRNKEALLAVQTGKLTLAGPFDLRQGGMAVIGRLPVFLGERNQEFWGFATALIRMDGFLKLSRIEELELQGYGYELWRTHPDSNEKHVFARSLSALADSPVTASIDVPNGRWHLSVAPIGGWTNYQWVIIQLLAVIALAIVSAWLVALYLRAQYSLAQSSARYRSLYQKTPAIMHSIDAEGRLVAVSDSWLKVLGYTAEEVIGRKSTDFFTEESRRYAVETVLPEFFRTGAVTDIPYQAVTKDGRTLDVLLSAISEQDAGSRMVRSLAVMTDVTQRKRAERALQDAKNYAENLIQTANVMIVELDQDGRLRRFNQAAQEVTGYSLQDVEGANWFELIAPKERYPAVWAEFAQMIATDGRIGQFENPILTKTGEERRIVWRNSQIVESGQVVGTLSFGMDVTEQRAIHDRLQQSEASLREAQSIALIGNWLYDLKKQELFWSDEIFHILEIDPATVHPSSRVFLERVHPDEIDRVKMAYAHFRTYHQPYEIVTQLLMPDGMIKYVSQRTRAVLGPNGVVLRYIGTLQDITMQTLQDMAFKESEERFRTIADYTYDWEYWQGTQGEMLYVSPSCERITGYSAADFISNPELIVQIVHPEDRESYVSHKRDITGKAHGDLTYRILTKDGQVRWVAHGCRAVFSHKGQPRGRRGSNRDITDLKLAEQRAHQLAYFDSLTNLPNRRMLMDRLQHGLTQAKRFQRALAVMFLDLDRFKQINDTLGHDAGDKLLVEVAERLSLCVRQGDTVSRTGGDEFIIVLPEISHPGDATKVAEKILEAISKPILVAGQEVDTSTSIGIAVYPVDGEDDAEELMKKADSAMYEAKRSGRNRYCMLGG